MANKVKAAVLNGYGINCDKETRYALALAGAQAEFVHVNNLVFKNDDLRNYSILAIPGGFSYGDDILAGKVLASKLRYSLEEQTQQFIADGGLMIGICNGFQVMASLGVLPGFDGEYKTQHITLTGNDSGRFRDDWVYLKFNPESPCVFTRGIEGLCVPVRHGEGKFVPRDDEILQRLHANGQVVARYANENLEIANGVFPFNPNGSIDDIAGICDPTGRIFGLMPHPEAYLFPWQHPLWTRQERQGTLPDEGPGVQVFRNAVEFVQSELWGKS